MKILIVGLKNNPQAIRIKEEAEKRGHTLDAVLSDELVIRANNEDFLPFVNGLDILSYNLIYLWTVSKRRWEWYTAALYLYKNYEIKIVNRKVVDPSYHYFLSPAMDYWKQKSAELRFPKSFIIHSPKVLKYIDNEFAFPVIVKATPSSKGRGVYKVNSVDEIKKVLADTNNVALTWVVREFIPNDGDIRVFTVGYKTIGAMKRTPKKGDFRSNISQGGSGEPYDLKGNPEIKKIAEKASEITETEIAGVDIILHKDTKEPFVLEINPGPQFTGLEEYTKTNAAEEIIKYFESLV